VYCCFDWHEIVYSAAGIRGGQGYGVADKIGSRALVQHRPIISQSDLV